MKTKSSSRGGRREGDEKNIGTTPPQRAGAACFSTMRQALASDREHNKIDPAIERD
jgi:hypothetical protein